MDEKSGVVVRLGPQPLVVGRIPVPVGLAPVGPSVFNIARSAGLGSVCICAWWGGIGGVRPGSLSRMRLWSWHSDAPREVSG
jgi:hypothetical protein